MAFLASALREEGGFIFKKAIVDALIDVIDNVSDAKERGLDHLCEFIEDCEFPDLLVRILMMLGKHLQNDFCVYVMCLLCSLNYYIRMQHKIYFQVRRDLTVSNRPNIFALSSIVLFWKPQRFYFT